MKRDTTRRNNTFLITSPELRKDVCENLGEKLEELKAYTYKDKLYYEDQSSFKSYDFDTEEWSHCIYMRNEVIKHGILYNILLYSYEDKLLPVSEVAYYKELNEYSFYIGESKIVSIERCESFINQYSPHVLIELIKRDVDE